MKTIFSPHALAMKCILASLLIPNLGFAETIANSSTNYYSAQLSATSPAQGQSSHLGFYKPDSKSIPLKVKAAASSVFYVATAAGQLTTVGAIFGTDHSIQEIIARVEQTPLSDQLLQADKDIYLYQLRICAKNAQPLQCSMYEGDKLSSGYLVADGSRIRTAFHAVSDLTQNKVQVTNGLATASVPVFVYDSSGKLIWSPASGTTSAVFLKSNLANSWEQTGRMTLPNDDLVELQLSKSIGVPLQPSSSSTKAGEPIYLIGYPKRSDDRAQYGAPDAPGGQLRISLGQVIPMDTASRKQGVDPADLTEQTKSFYRQMVVADADGSPGLSGGVAVNAEGQTIGTYTAGYPQDGSATPSHVSYISNDSLLPAPFKR